MGDLIAKLLEKLSEFFNRRISFTIIFVAVGVIIWIIIIFNTTLRKQFMKYVMLYPWFYLYVCILILIAILISKPVLPKYFAIYSDRYQSNTSKQIVLQPWRETDCETNNLIRINNSGNNYINLQYHQGVYGFGFQYLRLVQKNLSQFSNGYLFFSVCYYEQNISRLRIGIQSIDNHGEVIDSWIDLDRTTNIGMEEGWYLYKINLSQFDAGNKLINFSKVCQFFMVDAEAITNGIIGFDEIYWKDK